MHRLVASVALAAWARLRQSVVRVAWALREALVGKVVSAHLRRTVASAAREALAVSVEREHRRPSEARVVLAVSALRVASVVPGRLLLQFRRRAWRAE